MPAYVLRFWETEIPQLKPNKGGTGQRLYRKRDVEMALRIKSLLYDQGYTIPGARQVFKSEIKPPEAKGPELRPKEPQLVMAATPSETPRPTLALLRHDAALHDIRTEMVDLLTMLSKPTTSAPKEPKVQTMRPRLTVEPSRTRQLSLDGELF